MLILCSFRTTRTESRVYGGRPKTRSLRHASRGDAILPIRNFYKGAATTETAGTSSMVAGARNHLQAQVTRLPLRNSDLMSTIRAAGLPAPLVAGRGPAFDRWKPSGVSDWRLAEPHADPLSCPLTGARSCWAPRRDDDHDDRMFGPGACRPPWRLYASGYAA